MSKEIYISSTPQETRLAIVEKDELTEIYYERENEYTLAGSIYNGRVTRVLPGMQSSFVDIGLERDAFLYITDFMEEAADTADFEGAVTAGEPRSPRGERSRGEGRGERGRGRRDGRDGDRRPREAQPSSQAGPQTVPQAGPQTSPQMETARSRNSDDAFRNEAPAEDEGFVGAPREIEAEAADEGAVDGGRRWRGRRGRRRGRGSEDGPGEDLPLVLGAGDAVAQPQARAPRASEAPSQAQERRPLEPRGDRGRDRDRGGRDRGGRDRSGRGSASGSVDAPGSVDAAGRGDANGRGDRHDAVRERFAPRGPRPLSADDDRVRLDAPSEPLAEPFILPGESLSKYRHDEAGAPVAPPPAKTFGTPVAAKPSTEVAPLTGWDGGLVLPGETLRARSPRPEAQAESRTSARSGERDFGRGGDRGRDRRRTRDEERGRSETHSETRSDAAPTAYPTAPQEMAPQEMAPQEMAPQEMALQEMASQEMAPQEMNSPKPLQSAASPDTVPAFHDTAFQAVTTEYEPEENASASLRVGPAGQREFRQNVPMEAPPAPQEDVAPQEAVTTQEAVAPPEAVTTQEAETARGPETAPAAHEYTSLQPTGELISELPEVVAAERQQEEPSGPMEHEAVVQSVHAGAAETVVPVAAAQASAHESGEAAAEEASAEFAPGDGELEEELMDDEESAIGPLHASAFHEHAADTEQETLEGAADLGSMIRDMTIDVITRSDPEEADEEDDGRFGGRFGGEDEDEEEDEDEDFEEDELASSGEADEEDFEEEDEISGSEVSEVEEEEFAEASSFDENGVETSRAEGEVAPREGARDSLRRGRRDGRRGGRDRERGGDRGGERGGAERGLERSAERSAGERGSDRDRERGSGDRDRDRGGSRDRRGMAGSRSGGNGRDRGHRSMQATNLPAINDLLKPGQEVLVQIAKEPIAKKGARITSHIALPGRFLVFMPTVQHTGVSRKIESDLERRRLKEILLSEKGDAAGGFIVRTAAAGATEEELRSDLRFLLNLWADIKSRSESSKSPALIYHDLNLVERILRDQVTDNFSAIWVDTESEYERVLRFLQRFQPDLIRRVKLYTKDTPLFEQFGITEEINKALRAKVWLKSGGSIVINQTEALVAIDINTGKFVGKTAKLEDTILKTNLDAIPEIVRQIRLRDLGGIIIIDFIDMDERKNRNKVMAALEEELKSDRAPSKVLQFNDFGLVAITRKRVKQSLERTLSTTCGVCAGTGMVKSPVTVCNDIYIEMRKMHKIIEKSDMMLRVHPEVVKQLKAGGGKWLQEMEEMSGKTILVKSDPTVHPEQFDIL